MTRLSDEAPEPATTEPVRWGPILAMGLAMLMVTLEMSLASVTLPAIGTELGVGSAATKWVILAYALPAAALAIPLGRWVDHADARAVFLLAVTGVGLTSLVTAAAPAFWILLAARFLQGVMGALVAAVYMPIVAASVRPEQRGRALGYVATIMPVGSLAGAPLGGLVADGWGWRPVFLIKLPVLVLVLWLGGRLLPRGKGGLPAPGRSLLGDTLVLGGAVTALLLALDRIEVGAVAAAAVLAVLTVVLTAWWVRLRSSRPIIKLARRPAFGLPLLSLLLMASYIGLTLFLLPFYVSDVLHGGAGMMGLSMLFFIGAVALGSPISGWLADRYPPRLVLGAGGALTLAGTVSMLTLGQDAGVADLAWRLALVGIGQSLFNVPVNTAMLAATPPGMIGTGAGVGMTVRTLAFTVGPSLAALAYGLASGGAAGFRTGVIVLAVLQAAGLAAGIATKARAVRDS
ncbi:MFS transporter [Nonomuraea ceibae]|uniref:MFS transporter n=1 Tax=Nonomuraea ceibae TaxID=1935170 RepID=UPI001C5F51D5|nr:MFS transporter [Nonomuraea ceibae]